MARATRTTSAKPPTARGSAVIAVHYAIGDIHGCFGLLEQLWGEIEADARRRLKEGERATVVFLGDYVDRGPDSRRVLEWCERLRCEPPAWCVPVFLLGNHEALMLEFARSGAFGAYEDWVMNGGDAALESFGIPLGEISGVAKQLRRILHGEFAELFESLQRSHQVPGFLFVHAGINPEVSLAAQDPEDLIWIREPFLWSTADFGVRVVHGHTITAAPEVEILANRINVDTGAFLRGTLSAVVLQNGRVDVLRVVDPAKQREVEPL